MLRTTYGCCRPCLEKKGIGGFVVSDAYFRSGKVKLGLDLPRRVRKGVRWTPPPEKEGKKILEKNISLIIYMYLRGLFAHKYKCFLSWKGYIVYII